MNNKEGFWLFVRYLFLAIMGFLELNFKIFDYFLAPLTVYPVFWALSIIYENSVLLPGDIIFFGGFYAQIISACVAGAAYYLLLILNLTTPIERWARVKSLVFLFGVFLFLNVLRITVFALLLAGGYEYFDLAHQLTWYLGSTVMVVALWFVSVWVFGVRKIPILSDVKGVLEDLRRKDARKI